MPDEAVIGQPEQSAAQGEGTRRRWAYLLPLVFITYSLAYLDRANYGFGAAAGLAATLHISGSQNALLGSLFFLGYFLFQIPGASYAHRRSATRLVFFALLAWGALASLTGVIRLFWLLALDRTLLGVAESVIFPAMLILLSSWFTRSERSRANAILILGNPVTVTWMSAVTGYIIKAAGWQWAFIIEGVPSVVWAFVWIAVVHDHPRQAKWLNKPSQDWIELELEREQESLPHMKNLLAALRIPAVILLCAQFLTWSIGVYGLVLWLPTMIRAGSKQGIGRVGLLTAVPYLLAVILMVLVAYFSDRALERERFVAPFLILAGVAFFSSYLATGTSFWLSYVCLIVACAGMYAPYGPFWAIMPEMMPKNVSGEVMALVNSFGAMGGFIGAYGVGLLQAKTGSARAGIFLMSVALLLSGILTLCLPKPKKHPQPQRA